MYNFQAEEKDELAFKKGDILKVYLCWSLGDYGTGRWKEKAKSPPQKTLAFLSKLQMHVEKSCFATLSLKRFLIDLVCAFPPLGILNLAC